MDGWKTTFLLVRPIFRGYVSIMEDSFVLILQKMMVVLGPPKVSKEA